MERRREERSKYTKTRKDETETGDKERNIHRVKEEMRCEEKNIGKQKKKR